MSKIIIQMTPFMFEDGNTYYFQITSREYSNDYHDIYVFEKVVKKTKNLFGKVKIDESYNQLNERGELVSTSLDAKDIKDNIRKILIATMANYQLKDWDGFVGDVPDSVKIALKRDGKLKDILGD